jgi:hypothetical protein
MTSTPRLTRQRQRKAAGLAVFRVIAPRFELSEALVAASFLQQWEPLRNWRRHLAERAHQMGTRGCSSTQDGLEGIVAKRVDMPYRSDAESQSTCSRPRSQQPQHHRADECQRRPHGDGG